MELSTESRVVLELAQIVFRLCAQDPRRAGLRKRVEVTFGTVM
jgi:hypothetical protein